MLFAVLLHFACSGAATHIHSVTAAYAVALQHVCSHTATDVNDADPVGVLRDCIMFR